MHFYCHCMKTKPPRCIFRVIYTFPLCIFVIRVFKIVMRLTYALQNVQASVIWTEFKIKKSFQVFQKKNLRILSIWLRQCCRIVVTFRNAVIFNAEIYWFIMNYFLLKSNSFKSVFTRKEDSMLRLMALHIWGASAAGCEDLQVLFDYINKINVLLFL